MISDEDLNLLKKHQLDLIGWNYYRPCYITGDNYVDNLKELHQKSHAFLYRVLNKYFQKALNIQNEIELLIQRC